MNMRNGIPIVQSVKKSKQPQGRLWMAISNPYTRYIEMAIIIDECEARNVMKMRYPESFNVEDSKKRVDVS